MAKQYTEINEQIKTFIKKQKMFFVGTAGCEGRVNVSPKGMDTFRVLGRNRIAWLDLTGSGNESAAHVLENGRMTIMFCAFQGEPNILRLYGKAHAVHVGDSHWDDLVSHFPNIPGARQVFDMQVDMVQTSCGYAVPLYGYIGDRDKLTEWAKKKGEEGIRQYWLDNNMVSIDGKKTGMKVE